MFAYHAALAQEPWCFSPEKLRTISFDSARRLYLEPAIERQRVMRGEKPKATRPDTFEEFREALKYHVVEGFDMRAAYDEYRANWKPG